MRQACYQLTTGQRKATDKLRVMAKVKPGFNAQVLTKRGITVGSRIGQIVTLQVPADKLNVLEACDGVLYYNLARGLAPTCDNTRRDTRTDSVQHGYGLPQKFYGDSVLIGITDWGFDYTHINFNNFGDNHRIVAAWDQFRTAGPAPEGFDYGTEIVGYDDLILYQCDTSNLYDSATHGSHVAGIAAGRGRNNYYVGQAPHAQLLMSSFLLDESAWLDAVAWMKRKSEELGMRLVINSSWGMYTMGTPDGTSMLSQAINEYSQEGVVFVTSGGNNGDRTFHVEKTFIHDSIDTMYTYADYYFNGVGQALIMWGQPEHDFAAGFAVSTDGTGHKTTSPFYSSATAGNYQEGFVVLDGDTIHYNVQMEHSNIFNQRPHILLNVEKKENITLQLIVTAESGTVHAWNVCNLENHAGNMGSNFYGNPDFGTTNGDRRYGVGEPGCAASCITVAAHTADRKFNGEWYLGSIADFSSYGPTLGGLDKPEVSAPGVDVISSFSSFTTENNPVDLEYIYSGNGRTYSWGKLSGTSMSSPAVTGLVALMLQANPHLTPAEVQEILKSTARNDEMTGPLHERDSVSERWGWGKVDAVKAVNAALARLSIRTGVAPTFPLDIYPNPSTTQVTILTQNGHPETMEVYSTDGRLVLRQQVTEECVLDVSNWTKGVYVVRIGGRVGRIVRN